MSEVFGLRGPTFACACVTRQGLPLCGDDCRLTRFSNSPVGRSSQTQLMRSRPPSQYSAPPRL